MKAAIRQTVPIKSIEHLLDWVAGQESNAVNTGFVFAAYETGQQFAYAYYAVPTPADPTAPLPPLVRGQTYVMVSDNVVPPFGWRPGAVRYKPVEQVFDPS